MVDVAIIGAGPAGLKAAEVLSNAGKDVLVLEKNDKLGEKVCAAGLNKKGFHLIDDKLLERGFDTVKVNIGKDSVYLKDDEVFTAMINREKLAKWQSKNIDAEIRLNSKVESIRDNYVLVDGKKIGFDHLIGADGSSSIVRKSLGIGTNRVGLGLHYVIGKEFDEMEISFDAKYPWYIWVFPHKKYTSIGIGAGIDETRRLMPLFMNWLKERNIDVSNAKFEAALINHDYRGFIFGNKYLVGDAAGFTSGLTGEGIYQAMVSGEEVAKRILDKNYGCGKVKEILQNKARQERLIKYLNANRFVKSMELKLLKMMLKRRSFCKRLIELVC